MKKLFFYLPWIVLVGCVLFLLKQLFRIEIPLDAGDGLMHFFISNFALEKPVMYLNHWGKPFFTLLASPFTLFGYKGVIVFNLIIFILTSWIGFISLRALKVPTLLQALFPLALIYSYDYSSNVLSGLTEVLAGFMVVLSGYFLIQKKWIWMAICVSILPYCRSEGQLMIVLALLVLLYNKQYKIIPFLFTGFVIYAFIGWFSLGDFFWYFHNDPYPMVSPYGKGDWSHFWKLKAQYTGYLGLFLLVFSFISIGYLLLKKNLFSLRTDVVFFGLATFFGILFVHAYFWANGLKGSLGLTRVITIGLPILILSCLYLVSQLKIENKTYRFSFFFMIFAVCFLYNNTILRVSQNIGLDRSIIESSKFIQKNNTEKSKVYYLHPLFASALGVNILEQNKVYKQKSFRMETEDFSELHYGDFLIRDSHFGPVEMGIPLSVVEGSKEMVLINELFPSQPGESYHGEKWSVKIFQKIPIEKQQSILGQTSLNIPLKNNHFEITSKDTYVPVFEETITSNISFLEVDFTAKEDGGFLVSDINNGSIWTNTTLKQNERIKIQLPVKQNEVVKLYFWNPNKIDNKVDVHQINTTKTSYHPIYKTQ